MLLKAESQIDLHFSFSVLLPIQLDVVVLMDLGVLDLLELYEFADQRRPLLQPSGNILEYRAPQTMLGKSAFVFGRDSFAIGRKFNSLV